MPVQKCICIFQGHMFALCAVTQSCLTLCNPVDCSPPGTSVYGISQARMMEWVAIPSPGDLTEPGIKPVSPALHADSTTDPLRKPFLPLTCILKQDNKFVMIKTSGLSFLTFPFHSLLLATLQKKALPPIHPACFQQLHCTFRCTNFTPP